MIVPAKVRGAARFVEPLFILILVVLRLSITWNQPMSAIAAAEQDDRMFIDRAATIADMQWMGDYNQFTLMKGPGYPLIIATTYWLGIPLGRFQQVLWVVACLAFVRAASPLMRSPVVRMVGLVVLMFSPYGFNTSALARVLRQGIYPSLTLLVLACAVAIFLRVAPRDSAKKYLVWPWVIGLSIVLPVFWLTRDEGIWIVAPVGLIGLATVLSAYSVGKISNALRAVGAVTAPWGMVGAATLVVCTINWRYYGVFATIELRAPQFLSAYGALARVRPDPTVADTVVVSREARQLIYEVSPAFAELKSGFESGEGKFWADVSAGQFAPSDGEINGGWWLWALRDMVDRTPHGKSGSAALAFYQRIADEVNRACDDGRLPAEPFRPTLTPPWRPGYGEKLLAAFETGWRKLIVYGSIPPIIPWSSASGMQRFRKYTGSRLSSPLPVESDATVVVGRAAASTGKIHFEIRDGLGTKLRVDQTWRDSPNFYEKLKGDGTTWESARAANFELVIHGRGNLTLVALDTAGHEISRIRLLASKQSSPTFKAEIDEMTVLPGAGGGEWRVKLLGKIFHAYQVVTWWLLWPAGVGMVVGVVRGFRGHGWGGPVIVVALLVGVNVFLLMLSYIHFTSFPALSKGYIAPLPGCLLAAIMVALFMPVEMWIDRRKSHDPQTVPQTNANVEGT